jgi:hypothetical protein
LEVAVKLALSLFADVVELGALCVFMGAIGCVASAFGA